MTTFNAYLNRARDRDRQPYERWRGLTGCVGRFAPYGYRATLHSLTGNAGIPTRSWIERGGLDAALDDLSTARRIILDKAGEYARLRRQEKAAGRRSAPPPTVLAGSWLWRDLAYCPVPHRHPLEPMPIVVDRIARALLTRTTVADGCPACAATRTAGQPCPACGVLGRYRRLTG